MKKKKGCEFFFKVLQCVKLEGCRATAHFQLALGQDTTICIVTQGWGGWPGRALGAPMVGHDTAG